MDFHNQKWQLLVKGNFPRLGKYVPFVIGENSLAQLQKWEYIKIDETRQGVLRPVREVQNNPPHSIFRLVENHKFWKIEDTNNPLQN